MKFDKFAVAIAIQGILFCIFGLCTAYFGNKYFELKNKENVNILNLSGHRCIAVIKNNNVIDFHHNPLECDKCQKNTNTDKQQVKQLETNNKTQIFFVNEHQFELEYVIKKIQHSDNCPKCKETMKNFLYDVLIFDNNQQEINNIVEGYFNNGK